MEFISPMPFQEAVDKLGSQSVIASVLSSSEWQDVPLALRDNAFFSSRVESARFLQRAKDSLGDFLTGNKITTEAGETMLATGSRAAFVSQMQDFLAQEGVVRGKGGITDITSQARLGLIFDVKTRQAQDFGYWKQGMNPAVLNEFPAQRFIRVRDVKTEREWHIPFQDQVYLKTDPTWSLEINRDFGVPWGPWGWGCGHDVEDVDRNEAEQLGLIKPGERLQPLQRSINNNLQAGIATMDPDLVKQLKQAFGRQVVIKRGIMRWAPQVGTAAEPAVPEPDTSKKSSPVSAAIQIRVRGALRKQIDTALSAIDQVHDDGVLPKVPLRSTLEPDFGFLQPKRTPDGIGTDCIAVRATGPWPALTAVHEIGHLLDIEAIGPVGRMATRAADPEMHKVIAAAEKTDCIRSMRASLNSSAGIYSRGQIEYLLTTEEIWARAYAQYIAEKSGSPVLLGDLQKVLNYDHRRQWSTEDFAPVAKAIDRMFKKYGWL